MNPKKPLAPARLRTLAALLLAASASLGAAAQQIAAPTGAPVVARLGELTVRQDEVEKLLQALPDAERAAVKDNRASVEGWLRQRLLGEALLKEARDKGFTDKPEVKAKIDAAVRELTARIVTTGYLESVSQVPAGYPSEAELSAAYEQGKAGFNLPATYRVAQIFPPPPAPAPGAAPMGGAYPPMGARQARGGGDFAALARAKSQDRSSAERGGEVGNLPLARMLPEVRDAIAKLKTGQVGDPVQSAAGFHVVKLLDSQPARTATLEEMRPQLQAALRQQRQQQLIQAHLTQLAPATQLSIDAAALDAALRKTN